MTFTFDPMTLNICNIFTLVPTIFLVYTCTEKINILEISLTISYRFCVKGLVTVEIIFPLSTLPSLLDDLEGATSTSCPLHDWWCSNKIKNELVQHNLTINEKQSLIRKLYKNNRIIKDTYMLQKTIVTGSNLKVLEDWHELKAWKIACTQKA